MFSKFSSFQCLHVFGKRTTMWTTYIPPERQIKKKKTPSRSSSVAAFSPSNAWVAFSVATQYGRVKLVSLLKGCSVAVESSSHRAYVSDVSKKTPTSVPMLKPWNKAYKMIWHRNPQPGETALQKQRQIPRQIAMQLFPRHLQQLVRNFWMQVQRHEQHMMTAFYLLSSQMKSTRIKYSRIKGSRNARLCQQSFALGRVRIVSLISSFKGLPKLSSEDLVENSSRWRWPFALPQNKQDGRRWSCQDLVTRFVGEFTLFTKRLKEWSVKALVWLNSPLTKPDTSLQSQNKVFSPMFLKSNFCPSSLFFLGTFTQLTRQRTLRRLL